MTYTERIEYMAKIFDEEDVPYTMNSIFDGAQLRFPWCEGDVVAHSGVEWEDHGIVESYCFPWDDGDVTKLTPNGMADRIIALYDIVFRAVREATSE